MKKEKKTALAWIYSKPKEPIQGGFVLDTDISHLQQQVTAASSEVIEVLYMLPNCLASSFERHAISQWKKFYKTTLQLKLLHPNRIRLVSYEDLVSAGHSDRQATFLGNAFSLKVMDPDMFDFWCSLEAHAQLGNRQPVNASLLTDILSPGVVAKLNAIQDQLGQREAEVSAIRAQLQKALMFLHQIQARYEALESKPIEAKPSPEKKDGSVTLLIERLHKLQSEHEKLLEKSTDLQSLANKKGNSQSEVENTEHQRMREKLIFIQGELARQHAISHAYKTELVAVQAVLEKTRDFLTHSN